MVNERYIVKEGLGTLQTNLVFAEINQLKTSIVGNIIVHRHKFHNRESL